MKKSNIVPLLTFVFTFIIAFYVAIYKIDSNPYSFDGRSIIMLLSTFVLYAIAFNIWKEKQDWYIGMFIALCLIAFGINIAFILSVISVFN
jgi:hypothetical protein